jgi:LmbE family N-acetylglucosaminyl deacetylase
LKEERVLLVAPHSDDEIFGAGGTLLKWLGAGARVKLLLVCCSDVFLRHVGPVSGETRRDEFRCAARTLSNETPEVLGYPDQGLDGMLMSKLVSDLDSAISKYKPTTYLIPDPSYHQDHQYIYKACIASLRMTGRVLPKSVLEYEIPTSVSPGCEFRPNFYVDISDFQEKKSEVFVDCYGSQHTDKERGALSAYGMRRHAQYRGVEAGVQFAEAFRVVRMVK